MPRRFRNPQNDSDRAIAIQAGILSPEGEPLTRKDIFAMELMPNNSLENLLKKASKAGVHFRNGELWKIFQCRRLQSLMVYDGLALEAHARIDNNSPESMYCARIPGQLGRW